MALFRVWAPDAKQVEVWLSGRRSPMAQDPQGFWHAELGAEPEGDYAFVLDGGEPLPDPRSTWQPRGPRGLSRLTKSPSFDWTDRDWRPPELSTAVLYELHVGTFTPEGTFDAAIARLDHLVSLGVTHVELMPVTAFPGRWGWGYDVSSFFAPHAPYGGPDGLKRLVDTCHARGLAVILDLILNHFGPDADCLARFGPYVSSRYGTPWGAAPNLDGADSGEVRAFLIDAALHWLREYHLDGLRLDATHAMIDTSALHVLEELVQQARALESELGHPFLLIAENARNDTRLVHVPSIGGYGFDALWNDDFHYALSAVLAGDQQGPYVDFGSLGDLAKALTHGLVLDGRYSRFRRRRQGRPAPDLGLDQCVVYAQNHDQVGNRPSGDRTSARLSPVRLQIAAALTLTSPSIPMLFQGEEWGATTPFPFFADHDDPGQVAAARAGRERDLAGLGFANPAPPDPFSPATFRSAVLDWSAPSLAAHASLLDWHRRLIRLRRTVPDLGAQRRWEGCVAVDEEHRRLVIERGRFTLAVSLAPAPASIPIPNGSTLLLASAGTTAADGRVHLTNEGVALLGPAMTG